MLIDKINLELREAQLAREEIKVSTLRLLLSEIKNAQIAKGESLSDQDIISVIQREVKKRQEAAAYFRQGGREEQAQIEEKEQVYLQTFLPAQLTNEELTKVVEESINEVGAKTLADMGKVMGMVMSKAYGRADGGTVSALVKQRLSS